MKSLKPTTNFWVVFGTLAFLAIAYYSYMEFYVSAKESRIVSTRFRVLDQLGDNINEKIKSYNRNALQLEKRIPEEVDYYYSELKRRYPKVKYTKEAIVKYVFDQYIDGKKEFLNKDLELIDYKLDFGKDGDSLAATVDFDNQFIKTEIDSYYYFDPIGVVTTESISDDNIINYHDSLLVRTSYKNIMKGMIRNDVFDEMILLRKDVIVFSTLKSDVIIQPAEIINRHFIAKGEIERNNIDDPETKSESKGSSLNERIISGSYTDLLLSNKKYKLFYKPVKIGEEYWYAGGLMEVKHMNAAKRSILPWVIILISMVLILIVLGLPIIKLKVISHTEELETVTVINSALSVLLGVSVLTFFLVYLSQNVIYNQNIDKRLKELAYSIDTAFIKELNGAMMQVETYDSLLNNNILSFGPLSKRNTNLITNNILNLDAIHPAFPSVYHFPDFIFWAKNGIQTRFLTSSTDMYGQMSKIDHRDYYKYKDEWFFPSDSTKKFRLESILSISTGNRKLAISKESIRKDEIIAMTARFYSIIDPILPKNYGFCIIDEGGKVWFHSNKERNLMENFIEECNENKYIQAAIFNEISKPVNAHYYNKPHRIYLQPLHQIPLHLVTFYNRNNQTSFIVQVSTLVIVLLSVFFIFLIVQLSFLLILERKYQKEMGSNLIMNITRPKAYLYSHNTFLTYVYLIVAFVTAVLLHFMDMVQSMATVYAFEAIVFTFSYLVLNNRDKKKKQIAWFASLNILILVIINISLFYLAGFDKWIVILLLQVVLIVFLYASFKVFISRNPGTRHEFNRTLIRNYVLFLIAMSVFFSMLPTMAFYKIAYDKESEIHLRHYQVDLMKKKERRNAFWNKSYEGLLSSEFSTQVLGERKERGIYTKFLNSLSFTNKIIDKSQFDSSATKVQHSLLDSLIVFFRPFYDDEVIENKYLIYSDERNTGREWREIKNATLALKYVSKTEHPEFKEQEFRIITGSRDYLNFMMPFSGQSFFGSRSLFYNMLFWLTLISIMIVLYLLVRFAVRKLYSLDFITHYPKESHVHMIRDQIKTNKNMLLVKLSPRETNKIINSVVKADHSLNWSRKENIDRSKVQLETWIKKQRSKMRQMKTPDKTDQDQNETYTTVLIDHFEWAYDDPVMLNEKLDILLSFIKHSEIGMIIRSDVSFKIIQDYYRGIIKYKEENDKGTKLNSEVDDFFIRKIINKIDRLESTITSKSIPVNCGIISSTKLPDSESEKKDRYESLINKELNASDYLRQFKEVIGLFYHNNIKDSGTEDAGDMIINKINSLVADYYEDLFASCTPQEQYVLFDMADDLITNPNNSEPIISLLEKGLFVRKKDKLDLMNVSFRRFLISKRSNIDKAALEIQIGKKPGSWQGYRITLTLVIIGLFIFIYMTNQEFVSDLNQIFVILGGGIAVITGIIGLLSKINKSIED